MRFVAILLLFALTEAVKYFADDFEDNGSYPWRSDK